MGCGEGLLTIALSRGRYCAIGTDVSQTCIILAKRNKERFGAANTDFRVMNAAKMPFSPNSFDWIVSVDLLEHLHPEDAKSHLVQANKILKPNGRYLLITPNSEFGSHAGGVHIKEYSNQEIERIFLEAGFFVKYPLLNIASPINTLVNPTVKHGIRRLGKASSLTNLFLGADPIVVVAFKHD